MKSITVRSDKLNRVLADVEVLVEDVADLFEQDEIAIKRLAEIKKNPSIGRPEKELNDYLKKRGVKVG
jgi:hypothetical protein